MTKAKKAFKPIAGASAIGRLLNNPMAIVPNAAIKQVVTNTTCVSIPAMPKIDGFTNTIYTIVKKVVIPAITSVLALLPFSFKANNFSSILFASISNLTPMPIIQPLKMQG